MKQHLKNSWQQLVDKFFTNKISRAELDELLRKVESEKNLGDLGDALRKQWDLAGQQEEITDKAQWDHMFSQLMEKLRVEEADAQARRSGLFRRILRISVAAAIFLAAGGLYYLNSSKEPQADPGKQDALVKQVNQDLAPGKNGAVLTLADGKQISLDSGGQTILAVQGNATVRMQDGHIIYDKEAGIATEVLYNTVETPRGRQFQLLLADGSKVWLNSASSIRYPASFDGGDRHVQISGEAYFEVATVFTKDGSRKVPFTVTVLSDAGEVGTIEVLGTHFNVNTYDHADQVQATLLEGAIRMNRLNQHQEIVPGQQALIRTTDVSGAIKVLNKVDLEQVMAWKNGYFSFANSDLETVMRQIARWYDVDIEYAGKIPQRKFGGEISRNSNASQVLKVLEESGVHFKITGRKILVLP